MRHLTYEDILTACSPGGASVLTVVTELAPAAGPHAAIAPARYVDGRNPTYAFETRFVGGQAASAVVIDSKASQLNRSETAIGQAIRDGDGPLAQTPRIQVTYPSVTLTCLDLPHRAFDGHIRAGYVDGHPATEHRLYRAARDATPANVRPIAELSGVSPVLGAWDSTRRSNQARYRSALVGEIVGVLADQSPNGIQIATRGGARRDELAPRVRLSAKDMESLLLDQEAELSPGNVASIRKEIERAKKGTVSAASLGLGSIPPSLTTPGLVACRPITRSHVLSFAALRQLRFGAGVEGDAAGRALLAAFALAGLARSNRELVLRANCDLVEAAPPVVTIDRRYGKAE
ncbi:MAG: type I-U CRISPR-associated protein Cas7, partial [Propionicimonas sp.]|nr:type I-U CRISPR-associated protein Cas7 [Propionicimonas sp.]